MLRGALSCWPALTAGSNYAELLSTRAGKGMFWEICIIFMIPSLMFSEQTVVWGLDEVVVAIIELLFYRIYDSTLRKMNYFYSFSDFPLVTHPHFTEGSIRPW